MKKSHGFVQRVALAVLIANVGHSGLLAEGTDRKAPPRPVAVGPQLVVVSTSPGLARITGSGGESLAGQIESDSAFYELSEQRYPNGKPHIERYVAEDARGNLVNHGPFREYDPSGSVARSGNFAMGLMEGRWTQEIPSSKVMLLTDKLDAGFRGPFRSDANFIDGQLHGDWTISDAAGKPVLIWQFEFGKRHGVSTWFDSAGLSVREISYAADVLNGPAAELVLPEKEVKRQHYIEGRFIKTRTDWYAPGKKRGQEKVLVSAGPKIVAHDWWNGVVISEPFPGEAIRHGEFTTYHANGHRMSQGQFAMGEPVGEFTWWSENGQMRATGVFDSGERVGNWVWWHPNGVKMVSGNYERGNQIGQWSHWNADGRLLARAEGANFRPQNLSLEMQLGLPANKEAEAEKVATPIVVPEPPSMKPDDMELPFVEVTTVPVGKRVLDSRPLSDPQPAVRNRSPLPDQENSIDILVPNDAPVAVAVMPSRLRKIEVPASRRRLR